MMSSAVNGAPSDHFMPSRRKTVHCVKSSFDSQPLAMCGHDLGAVGRMAHQGVVDDAGVVVVIRGPEEATAQRAAIGADLLDHLLDQRLGGQTLLDRRQLAGLDHRRQRRRLVVLLCQGGPGPGQREAEQQAQAAARNGRPDRCNVHCEAP